MATVRRDVVYPRKVFPASHPQGVDLAPLIPHLEKRQKEFLEAGLPIPYVWRHDDEAFPGSKSLRLTQGDGRLQLGEVKDGKVDEEGILVDELEVPNEKDHEQLKACRHVSPWIKKDWKDGTGKVWPGWSILHVAVAPRPVQPTRAFKLSHDGQPEELFLAMADYERGDEMAEEKPEKESKKEIKAGDGFGPDILDCLKDCGLPLPPDTDEKNIWERIRIVCHGRKGGEKKPDQPEPVANPETPMGLSHDQQAALDRGERASKALLKLNKEKTRDRIKTLQKTCRVSGDIAKAMYATLDGDLKLSLDDNGDLAKNDLLVEIAAYEKLPEGAAMGNARLAHGDPVPEEPPTEGVLDGSKINPKLMARMTGGRWKDGDVGFDD